MAGRIEDYALIGDMQTAALVSRTGAVDWLCLPRFDSPAVFAGLLGTQEHGGWQIAPVVDGGGADMPAARRRYRGETLVLEQEWDTEQGSVRVTDLMPPRAEAPQLVRIVEGLSGEVPVRSQLRLRFSYGRIVPWVYRTSDERTVAIAGPDSIWLDTEAETHGQHLTTYSDFTVCTGERVAFTMTWKPSHQQGPEQPRPMVALANTERFWLDWVSHCTYHGPYREPVIRSLITLKALTYEPTGGIVAAPTTSLPEEVGGERNWDYRFTWLRDAAITLSSLLRTGYREEARAWREWLLRAVAGDPENLQIMYAVAGERELVEGTLDWLPGYEGSQPVRVGNSAAEQMQLDVYGEVVEALHLGRMTGLDRNDYALELQLRLISYLEEHWMEPDEGIWEVRGPRQHFVHSKVMAWTAVDRTIRMLEQDQELLEQEQQQQGGAARSDNDVLLRRWRELRQRIHDEVCTKGYDPERNTFTQYYGSTELDASLLQIPQVGFLPPDDKRVIGTIEAIQRELDDDGFVLRYPTGEGEDATIDGLSGDEGAFLACSFWLADDLAMIGRVQEARALFERLLSLRNDVGLLAEEWDSASGRQVGNFPQAFSHVALIDTALRLTASGAFQ